MNLDCFYNPIDFQKKYDDSNGLLLINKDYQQLLTDIGFTTYDAIWSCEDGELIKQKNERSVIKIQLPTSINLTPQQNRIFYIKKHRERISLWKKLRSIVRKNTGISEGLKEFHHYCNFRKNGLATAIPVAAGMKISSFFQIDSFLITQDFLPFIELEDYILNKPDIFQDDNNQAKKKIILQKIAQYARRMHDTGMNQQDFNATHILLHNIDNDNPAVALFDLQRVDTNPLKSFRWPIKALAELFFSLPSSIFSEKDKVFLFSSYKKNSNLSFLNRLQYFWITKKRDRIAKHTQKRGLAPKMSSTD